MLWKALYTLRFFYVSISLTLNLHPSYLEFTVYDVRVQSNFT